MEIPDKLLTTVGHIKQDNEGVYIGRSMLHQDLTQSKFANPYKIGRDGTRKEVIHKYRERLASRPDLVLAAIRELSGKHLLCWCHPQPCHGDILANTCNQALLTAMKSVTTQQKRS